MRTTAEPSARRFGQGELLLLNQSRSLPWIGVSPGAPYFCDDVGNDWTPVGHNESISWPTLAPLFARRDAAAVEGRLQALKASGVTCIRLMLECAHSRYRYFERPVGRFNPRMVQLWDDLFTLCERIGMRVLNGGLSTPVRNVAVCAR
jgi:hypothetical protein